MKSTKKTKRGRPSKVDEIPNIEKEGGSSLDSFKKQMQKNK